MKIRLDFVTNSSSSSFIICFARIEDEEKAKKIIDKYENQIRVYDSNFLIDETDSSGNLGVYWADAMIWGAADVAKRFPDSKYIIIEERLDADYDDDGEPVYDYDFSCLPAINEVTEKNGFADIDVAEGGGRDG